MGLFDAGRVRQAYDAVAAAYAGAFGDELDHLPLDAELVDWLAAHTDGAILELGAGVAPVSRRLSAHHVVAADLSAQMLAHAPSTASRVRADVRTLPFRDAAFAAATFRYVLQHVPRTDAALVLSEIRRVLQPGGWLLTALHLGEGDVEFSELLGTRFEPVGGALYSREQTRQLLTDGGFEIVQEHERGPVDKEGSTQRLYVLAMRSGPTTATPTAGTV